MNSMPSVCSDCAEGLLVDDVDPALCEQTNSHGQRVLARRQTEDNIRKGTPYRQLDWAQFLNGNREIEYMTPDSCGFCNFLLQLLESDVIIQALRRQQEKTGIIYDEVGITHRTVWEEQEEVGDLSRPVMFCGIRVSFRFYELESHRTFDQFYFLARHGDSGSPEVATWLQCHDPPTTGYLDAEYTGWMRRQLAICDEGHSSDNNVGNTNGFIPQRLLQVASTEVKLINPASPPTPTSTDARHPKYAALSYCWGEPSVASTQITSTKATIHAREAGIPMEDLTQTLREAVQICQSLDIPYLWVDALCILQDDDDDWSRQCVDMCKIYSNAYVTLCASSSQSCSDSFTDRKGQLVEVPFESERHPSIRGKYLLRAVYTGRHLHRGNSDAWDKRFTPWATRGWVLQERVAACRSITFGEISLHYECQYATIQFGNDSVERPDPSLLPFVQRKRSSWKPPVNKDLLARWSRLVSSQAHRGKFTRADDLLPSLSGLASSLKEDYQGLGGYAAGLWTNHLYIHLCYFEPTFSAMDKLPTRLQFFTFMESKELMVPRWSPLSGSVSYPQDDLYPWHEGRPIFMSHRPQAAIHVKIDFANDLNPFGAMKSGFMEVRSLALDLQHPDLDQLQLSYRPDPRLGVGRNDHDVHGHAHLSNGKHRICKIALDFLYPRTVHMGEDTHPRFGPVDASMDLPKMRLLLLGSCRVQRPKDGRCRKGRGAFGLVLWPSPTNPQRWRRIGVFFPSAARGWYREGYRVIKRLGVMEETIVE